MAEPMQAEGNTRGVSSPPQANVTEAICVFGLRRFPLAEVIIHEQDADGRSDAERNGVRANADRRVSSCISVRLRSQAEGTD